MLNWKKEGLWFDWSKQGWIVEGFFTGVLRVNKVTYNSSPRFRKTARSQEILIKSHFLHGIIKLKLPKLHNHSTKITPRGEPLHQHAQGFYSFPARRGLFAVHLNSNERTSQAEFSHFNQEKVQGTKRGKLDIRRASFHKRSLLWNWWWRVRLQVI